MDNKNFADILDKDYKWFLKCEAIAKKKYDFSKKCVKS